MRAQRFVQMNLSGADFSDQGLAGAQFVQCNLSGATFEGATIASARFSQCNLTGAVLPSYALMVATFVQCNMAGVRYVKTSPKAAPAKSTLKPAPEQPRAPSSQGAARPSWSMSGQGRA